MDLADTEYDALLNILTNNAIRRVLEKHKPIVEEEQALRDRWNSRIDMFATRDDEYYANNHIKALLNGHPDLLRIRTRLTRFQFETLLVWLAEEGGLSDSKYVTVDTKLAIFMHICGQGALYRDIGKYWKVPWS